MGRGQNSTIASLTPNNVLHSDRGRIHFCATPRVAAAAEGEL
jgi:hypothetical protein